MYDLLDRPVARLNPSGRVILRAMRVWARDAATGKCACVELQALFASHGLFRSVEPLRLVMAALRSGARRNISFRHPDCPTIGEDEAMLLTMIRQSPGRTSAHLGMASRFVVGARLPQFVHGMGQLMDSLGVHDSGPCITAATGRRPSSGSD